MVMNRDYAKIKQEYREAVDADVKGFVEDVIQGKDKINYVTVAFLSKDASSLIKELTEKDVEGSRVVLDTNAVIHILNRHGVNGKQDQSMMNIDDIARIGYVISNYDRIEYDGRTTTGYLDENGKPSPLVKISKRINGTYYVIEAVNSSKKKKNYIISAFIGGVENEEAAPLIPDTCISLQDTSET